MRTHSFAHDAEHLSRHGARADHVDVHDDAPVVSLPVQQRRARVHACNKSGDSKQCTTWACSSFSVWICRDGRLWGTGTNPLFFSRAKENANFEQEALRVVSHNLLVKAIFCILKQRFALHEISRSANAEED